MGLFNNGWDIWVTRLSGQQTAEPRCLRDSSWLSSVNARRDTVDVQTSISQQRSIRSAPRSMKMIPSREGQGPSGPEVGHSWKPTKPTPTLRATPPKEGIQCSLAQFTIDVQPPAAMTNGVYSLAPQSGSLLAPCRVSYTRLIECLDLPGVGRTGPGGSLSVKPGDPEVRMTDRSTNQSLRR
jgi:hypothetical protein